MDVLYYDILYTIYELHFLMAKDCLLCINSFIRHVDSFLIAYLMRI